MNSPKIRIIALVLFLAPFLAAEAQWSHDPATNNSICRSGNNQKSPRLVSDGKGGNIICWADERNGKSFYQVFVQRIDKDGFVRWTENGVPVSPVINTQLKPDIVSDGDGGAIIVWTDQRNIDLDVYAQRIDSSGSIVWQSEGVPVATGSQDQTDPKLVSDGQHGAIVTWSAHTGFNQDGHIYAQRLDGGGNRLWSPAIQLSTSDQFETTPCITTDGSGGAYVAWVFYNNQDYDVYAQRIHASGAQQWQMGGISFTPASGAQDTPSIVADGTGKAFLTYYDWTSGSGATLQVVVLNGDGSAAASLRATSTSGGQANPSLTNVGPGQLGLVWEDGRVGGKTRTYAQIIDNTGSKSWAADGVEVSNRTGSQATPTVVSDENGGIIVCWEDMTGGVAESDLYAQKISVSGSLLWSSAGVPLCTAAHMQQFPRMRPDGEHGAVAVWEDYRSSFTNPDILASRILADGTFPIGPPILTFSSTSVAFGAASIGFSSTKSITVTNSGGSVATLASVSSSDPHFTVSTDNSTIDPSGSVTATIKFQPTSKDVLNAFIIFESDSPFSPDSVAVSGWGTGSPSLTMDRTSLPFGSVKVGSAKSLVLNISNTGNDTLTITSITANTPEFTVAVDAMSLPPGAAFDDTVRFSPTALGTVTGVLTVVSNVPTSPTTLPLSGTGAPLEVTLSMDPTYIFFGDVPIGSTRDTTLTVTNTGNDTLRITAFTSSDPHFTMETPLQPIAPAGNMALTLRFAPADVGSVSTYFTVTSNAVTSPDTIGAQGTGTDVSAVRSTQVVPGVFTLYQSFPNPFSLAATIRYDLAAAAPVRLTVYDAVGKVVAILADDTQTPGLHSIQWAPEDERPGVYFFTLRVGSHQANGRMIFMQ